MDPEQSVYLHLVGDLLGHVCLALLGILVGDVSWASSWGMFLGHPPWASLICIGDPGWGSLLGLLGSISDHGKCWPRSYWDQLGLLGAASDHGKST